jgi:peptide methionine sulfoxide reductase MsrA
MKRLLIELLALFALVAAAAAAGESGQGTKPRDTGSAGLEKAIFAGGCFWCMEPPFEKLPGVVSVISGYTGGTGAHPTYAEVSAGGTGHAEVVQIVYDPSKITYSQLLEVF